MAEGAASALVDLAEDGLRQGAKLADEVRSQLGCC